MQRGKIMSTYAEAVPAYGRDYTSAKAVKADWDAGKDFQVLDARSSGYINKDGKPAGLVLQVRYARLRRSVLIR